MGICRDFCEVMMECKKLIKNPGYYPACGASHEFLMDMVVWTCPKIAERDVMSLRDQMFNSDTPVEIKCPRCGRIQIVDLYFWQVNQSWWKTGIFWQKMHPFTCENHRYSVEMVPAWESDD